jgi:hypothetical protein
MSKSAIKNWKDKLNDHLFKYPISRFQYSFAQYLYLSLFKIIYFIFEKVDRKLNKQHHCFLAAFSFLGLSAF